MVLERGRNKFSLTSASLVGMMSNCQIEPFAKKDLESWDET